MHVLSVLNKVVIYKNFVDGVIVVAVDNSTPKSRFQCAQLL